MNQKKSIDVFISCGESSGDVATASLLSPLQDVIRSQNWAGVIGPELSELGVHPLKGLDGLQVMGFTAVFRALNRLRQHMHWIENSIFDLEPKVVLLVDYPGFHLKLAKRLREKGFKGKIIQYICPSVWAWKRHRLKTLKAYYDEVWGILPFEAEALTSSGLSYLYTGNPSFRLAQRHRIEFGNEKRECWGLFPGSRPQEIRSHLPQLLEAAELYEKKYPGQKWLLSIASEESLGWIQPLLTSSSLQITLVPPEKRWQEMHRMKAAVAVSGTVCLELALHRVPAVAVYACGLMNYLLAKYLFKIKLAYFTLPNLILKRVAFPELIGAHLKSQTLFKSMEQLFEPLQVSQLQQAIGELESKLISSSETSSLPLERMLHWIKEEAIHSDPMQQGSSHSGGRF